jgi:hypothetical protein
MQDTALEKAARIEAEAREKAARIEAEAREKAERTLDEAHQAAGRIEATARAEAEEIKATARDHADGRREDLLPLLLAWEKIFFDGATPAPPNAGRHVLEVDWGGSALEAAFNSSELEKVIEQVAACDADRFLARVRPALSHRLFASYVNEVLGRRLATMADVSSLEDAERLITALSARYGSRAWRRRSRHQERRIDGTCWSMQTSFYPMDPAGKSWAQLGARELANRSDFGGDLVEFVHHDAPWWAEMPPDPPTDLILVGTAGQTILVQCKHWLREGRSPRPEDVSGVGNLPAALRAFLVTRMHERVAAVLLIGPAGTGKIRLVAALADALTSPAFALEASAEKPPNEPACRNPYSSSGGGTSPPPGIADVLRSISCYGNYVVDPLGVCAPPAHETPATVRHSEDHGDGTAYREVPTATAELMITPLPDSRCSLLSRSEHPLVVPPAPDG